MEASAKATKQVEEKEQLTKCSPNRMFVKSCKKNAKYPGVFSSKVFGGQSRAICHFLAMKKKENEGFRYENVVDRQSFIPRTVRHVHHGPPRIVLHDIHSSD